MFLTAVSSQAVINCQSYHTGNHGQVQDGGWTYADTAEMTDEEINPTLKTRLGRGTDFGTNREPLG